VLYGVTAAYFSGVMVRLMLVLAPAVCCLAGVAVSDILNTLSCSLKASGPVLQQPLAAARERAAAAGSEGGSAGAVRTSAGGDGSSSSAGLSAWHPLPKVVAIVGFVGVVFLLVQYTIHCVG